MPPPPLMRSWTKWFILYFLGLSLLIFPLLLHHEKNRVEAVKARQSAHLSTSEHLLSGMLYERIGDINLLASSPALLNYVTQGTEEDRKFSIQQFESFCHSFEQYTEVKLIRANGQELLKINASSGNCSEAPQSELLNRKDCPYLATAKTLSLGEFFISPMELDTEGGIVTTPYQPRICLATPLIDAQNKVQAVVSVKYSVKDFLGRIFPDATTPEKSKLFFNYLVNERGYYLKSEEAPEREFAFMPGREEERFDLDYPEAWNAMQAGKTSIRTKKGLFLIKTFMIPSSFSVGTIHSEEKQWHLFQLITNHDLYATSIIHGPNRLAWMGCYLLIIAIASNLRARREEQSKESQSAREKYRQLYERDRKILAASGDGIYGVDLNGNATFVNPAAEKMLGWTEAELLGKNLHELIHFNHRDGSPYPEKGCPICSALTDGKNHRVENEVFWQKDGTSFPVSYISTPIVKNWKVEGAVVIFQDISERLRREERLRRTSRQLKKAKMVANLGIWELDHAQNTLIWSDEIYKIFELDQNVFKPSYSAFLEAIHPEDRDQVSKAYEKSLITRKKYKIVHRLVMKDGRIKWVEEQCDTEFDNEGNPILSIGTVYDITDQKRIDEERLCREAQLQAITDASQDAIIMMDPKGAIVFWNPAAEKILGYTEAEAFGKDLHELVMPERYLSAQKAAFPEFLKTGTGAAIGKNIELFATHKDGHEICVSLSIGAIKQNEQWYAVGMVRDITERIEAQRKEELLLKEERSLLSLFDKGDSVLFKWNHDANWSIAYVSDNVKRLFGFGKQEFMSGKVDYASLIHPEDLPKVSKEVELAVRSNLDFFVHDPYRILTYTNEVRWVFDYTVTQKNEEGEITHFIGYLNDITGQINNEKALEEAKAAAEAANQAKSDFLSTMSHEIRTPLNAVISSAYLLKHTELTDEQRDDIDAIEVSSKSLLSLINETLDFSKIEAGQMQIDHQLFSLNELLRDIYLQFSISCRNKGVNLEIPEAPAELPLLVIGDSNRLRQMLLNLLSNAVKFTEDGTILLAVKHIEPATDPDKLFLRFSVTDSGIGMTRDVMDKLFHPFTQADMSTSRKYGGTGLGLSIVKKLAELMGGGISVESEIGVGSTFHIDIPLGIGESSTIDEQKAADLEHPLAGMRIMGVDDNLLNLKALERIITHEGATPTMCRSAKECLDELKKNPDGFDMVLMDVQMPEMDGREATIYIRKTMKLNLPIIALTGGVTSFEKDRAYAAGMNDFLAKPIDPPKLIRTVLHQRQKMQKSKEG